jgi:hypothetical protein
MKRELMGLIHLLVKNKLSILLSLFIYIFLWFTIGILKQSTIPISYQNDFSTSNLYIILEHLSKFNINLLLIDPFLLFIRQLSFQQLQQRLITFGIFNESMQSIHLLFSVTNFSIKISQSFNKPSLDHIFIEYNQQIIHLAVLYEENSYFLVQKTTVQLPIDVKLSYGDTLRVIEP